MGPSDPLEHKSLQPWRILVVEDDPSVRQAAVDVLEHAGYPLDIASDGVQALARLGQTPRPDLILLDLLLPGLDGWQLRAAQMASPTLADIPVLAMSGDDSAQARAINADGYLPKPFNPADCCRLWSACCCGTSVAACSCACTNRSGSWCWARWRPSWVTRSATR